MLCRRLGNHAFPKPIRVVFSCGLGNHALHKPITVVVSFIEPINELGDILSQFDDMETNFSAPGTRGLSLAFYFGSQAYLLFQWASGARVLARLEDFLTSGSVWLIMVTDTICRANVSPYLAYNIHSVFSAWGCV